MLIVCPSCASEYEIDAAYLQPRGRKVRCAACRETFFVAPPEDESPAGAAEAQAETIAAPAINQRVDGEGQQGDGAGPVAGGAGDARPSSRRRGWGSGRDRGSGRLSSAAAAVLARARTRLAGGPGTALLALAVLAMVAGLVLARERVVGTVPQTAGLFAAIGLPVNLRGLEFSEVRSSRMVEDSETILVVEGQVSNPSRHRVAVPAIRISLWDDTRESLYTWSIDPPRAELAAGETASFRARLIAPPEAARQVLVRFEGEPARTVAERPPAGEHAH